MQMPEKKVFVALFLIAGALGSLYFTFGESIFGGESSEIASDFEDGGGEDPNGENSIFDETVDGEDQGGNAYGDGSSNESGGKARSRRNTSAPVPLAQGSVADRVEGILDRLYEKRRSVDTQENGHGRPRTAETAGRGSIASENSLFSGQAPVHANVLPEFALTGVLVGENRSCALIGGYILKEGDMLPTGHQVVKIFRKSVHLRRPGISEDIIKFIEPRSRQPQNSGLDETDEDLDPLEEITENTGAEAEG